MDDLNVSHNLGDSVQGLGHGVALASQKKIDSKTMVCYLDNKLVFHYGFYYKNGNTLRVAVWEKEEGEDAKKRDKAVPSGAGTYFIVFPGIKTQKGIDSEFFASDFAFDWFDDAAQKIVKDELLALIPNKEKIQEIVDGIGGLNIDDLDEVSNKIQELRHRNNTTH